MQWKSPSCNILSQNLNTCKDRLTLKYLQHIPLQQVVLFPHEGNSWCICRISFCRTLLKSLKWHRLPCIVHWKFPSCSTLWPILNDKASLNHIFREANIKWFPGMRLHCSSVSVNGHSNRSWRVVVILFIRVFFLMARKTKPGLHGVVNVPHELHG